ncbi:hypothetical protein [Duganella callida]|uniref:Uncharacterized protein n=1 Tax=Duganella callida TaxID=2561932 RepID=A0A4Y9RZZ2_9BURK|nr:hypothetical protein [Duganella callida]TFW13781.1 hypothetical protein E4L98_28375 [Duganella callida]
MKLCGVEIPADIEIPPLDAESKAELDELHEHLIRNDEKVARMGRLPGYKYVDPPENYKPMTISVGTLRGLSPWARARVLYLLRDQVTY